MIRIYADESDSVELVLQDSNVKLFPLPVRLGTPKAQRQPARRRSIGLLTAALLVGVSAGSGYLLAAHSSRAHTTMVAAAPPPSDLRAPPQPNPVLPGPATGPNAVARALDSQPAVTPPPAPEATTPPGVAAFGLKP